MTIISTLSNAAPRRFCAFRLGGDCFAIEANRVTEVIRGGRLARVPLAPPVILGLSHMRGRIVPVIDLAAQLGVDSTRDASGVHLVVRLGDDCHGLLVDEMLDVIEIPATLVERPTASDVAACIGVFAAENRLVHLLDPEAIIQSIPPGPRRDGPTRTSGEPA
jgi:purine-binding chemotaxis protein CheW